MNIQRIGFDGLGLMGHGMAANLARKGFPLAVKVNRDRSRLADILAAGAKECATNAEVAQAADVVIICVTGSPQVEDIVFGEAGLLAAARPGLLRVDPPPARPGSAAAVRAPPRARGTALGGAPLP